MANYITSNQVTFGKSILPIKMVELFSADDWEEFIEEWLDLKKADYVKIERIGGAGDGGIDVRAYVNEELDYEWDCFQCKQYANPLTPTEVYVEFGKILYYTYIKDYPVPRRYYFVSPKGCGTSLSKLLSDPNKLKEAIIHNWDNYCKNKITSTTDIKLDTAFLYYIENFNFEIFNKVLVKNVIEEHQKHPNHLIRFGGRLPERHKLTKEEIPDALQPYENRYVSQLLLSYGSESGIKYITPQELAKSNYNEHFKRARISFHHAEQLRNFYRDTLPVDTFEDFQEEIYLAIVDIAENDFENGFVKVKEVETEARKVVISSNPLKDVSVMHDKTGVCHQLSNNRKLTWIKDE